MLASQFFYGLFADTQLEQRALSDRPSQHQLQADGARLLPEPTPRAILDIGPDILAPFSNKPSMRAALPIANSE